jgi:hypothetical protein
MQQAEAHVKNLQKKRDSEFEAINSKVLSLEATVQSLKAEIEDRKKDVTKAACDLNQLKARIAPKLEILHQDLTLELKHMSKEPKKGAELVPPTRLHRPTWHLYVADKNLGG